MPVGWTAVTQGVLELVAGKVPGTSGVGAAGSVVTVDPRTLRIGKVGWDVKRHLRTAAATDDPDLQRAQHAERIECRECKAHAYQLWRELRVNIAQRAAKNGRCNHQEEGAFALGWKQLRDPISGPSVLERARGGAYCRCKSGCPHGLGQ